MLLLTWVKRGLIFRALRVREGQNRPGRQCQPRTEAGDGEHRADATALQGRKKPRAMKGLLVGLAALAAMALARTDVMVPLYVYPGNQTWTNPEWAAALDAIKANPDLHFYVIINPNNGPLNTSDPSGRNGGFCNVYNDTGYIAHGCNRDWTTHLAALTALPNAQPLGYVYMRYGARARAAVRADIAEWAAWGAAPAPTWTRGARANISVAGLWFDEVGAAPGNASLVADLVAFANATFAAAAAAAAATGQPPPPQRQRQYTVVLNAGAVPDPAYEARLFALASAVVTKETCYTADAHAAGAAVAAAADAHADADADAAAIARDCPAPYEPFDAAALAPGHGLPHDAALRARAVVLVHQFVGPPAATEAALRAQLRGVAALGVHSTYFTSGSWHQTTTAPATIGAVGRVLREANAASAAARGGWAAGPVGGWAPWVCAFWSVRQTLGGLYY